MSGSSSAEAAAPRSSSHTDRDALTIGGFHWHSAGPPIQLPSQRQQSWDQKRAHHERVDQDAKDHREAHLAEERVVVLSHHAAEGEHNDYTRCCDDGACGSQRMNDGLAVLQESLAV